MITLQDQLAAKEKEEILFKNANNQWYRLAKLIDQKENISYLLIYAVGAPLFLFNYFQTEPKITLIEIIKGILLSVYPGSIVVIFLGLFIQELIPPILHLLFNKKKKDYKTFIAKRDKLLSSINEIKKSIHQERQQNLMAELEYFLYRLKKKQVSVEEVIVMKNKVEFEVNLTAPRIYRDFHKEHSFRDSLKTIDKYLKWLQEPKTSTIKPLISKPNLDSDLDSSQNPFTTNTPSKTITHTTKTINNSELNTAQFKLVETKNESFTETKSTSSPLQQKQNNQSSAAAPIKTSVSPEEKSIEELFPNQGNNTTAKREPREHRTSVKTDYLKLNEHRQNIGLLGELFVLEWEKERLERIGPKIFSDKIIHISQENDSSGFDIISYFENGRTKYIEVKTTTDNYNTPFYLTETELTAMRDLDNFFIYRVYNFDIASGKGKLFIMDCKKEIEKYYQMEPISYRVSPKW